MLTSKFSRHLLDNEAFYQEPHETNQTSNLLQLSQKKDGWLLGCAAARYRQHGISHFKCKLVQVELHADRSSNDFLVYQLHRFAVITGIMMTLWEWGSHGSCHHITSHLSRSGPHACIQTLKVVKDICNKHHQPTCCSWSSPVTHWYADESKQ